MDRVRQIQYGHCDPFPQLPRLFHPRVHSSLRKRIFRLRDTGLPVFHSVKKPDCSVDVVLPSL